MSIPQPTRRRATRRRGARRYRAALPLVCAVLLALCPARAADDVTLTQVFAAVDANHDRTISEGEFTAAMHALIGGGAGDGGGAAPPPGAGAGRTFKRPNFENPADTAAFLKALFASFSAIMATEIGDKTFFIAAILSMRNDRAAVFGGAVLALIVMTILSTLMGLVLPALLPKKYTHILGGVLFLYFGCRLLYDSRGMENKVSEELEEVEEELAEMNKKRGKARQKQQAGARDDGAAATDSDPERGPAERGEAGRGEGAVQRRGGGAGKVAAAKSPASGMTAAGSYSGASWEATFLQALTMTFVAEWGDRSQIATIALAAAKDPIGVTVGGCLGHSVCTGVAVVGGRLLAARISEKSVSFYGGLVFLAFGIHSAFFEE